MRTQILRMQPPLVLDVERLEPKVLDYFEAQPSTRLQIDAEYQKWQRNHRKLGVIK